MSELLRLARRVALHWTFIVLLPAATIVDVIAGCDRLQHLHFGRVWVALAKTFTFLAGAALYLAWLEPYLRSFGGWWLTDIAEVHGGIHNTVFSCVEAIGRGAALVVGGTAILFYNAIILALHLWLAAPVRSAVALLVATVLAHC